MRKSVLFCLLIFVMSNVSIVLYANGNDNNENRYYMTDFICEGYVADITCELTYSSYKLFDDFGNAVVNNRGGNLFIIYHNQKNSDKMIDLLLEAYHNCFKISVVCSSKQIKENNQPINLANILQLSLIMETEITTNSYTFSLKQTSRLCLETINAGTLFIELKEYPIEFIVFPDSNPDFNYSEHQYFICPYEKKKLSMLFLAISLNKPLTMSVDKTTGHITSLKIE